MAYICPMHPAVRQEAAGKSPRCGMQLLPEGTRFALLRHMLSRPWHVAGMIAVMLALMAAAMMLLH
jgi:Heavy metal binding domain